MKNRLFVIVIVICIICTVFATVLASPEQIIALKATYKILLKGTECTFENPPLVVNGRTYLPLRATGELLGVDIVWNEELRRVEIGENKSSAKINNVVVPVYSKDKVNVSIGSVTGKKGESVLIPVQLNNIPAKGIFGGRIELLYDKANIDIESVSSGSIVPDALVTFSHNINKDQGIVRLTFSTLASGTEKYITSNGEYALIKAKIKSDARSGNSAIRFVYGGYFEDKDIVRSEAAFTEGYVRIE
ncbi:MAG: cohesin domain-containing protein [Clostridia bacterium]|nr:cohesin domain-containing protein [Clostridia bacterium]